MKTMIVVLMTLVSCFAQNTANTANTATTGFTPDAKAAPTTDEAIKPQSVIPPAAATAPHISVSKVQPEEIDQLKLELLLEKYNNAHTKFSDAYLAWLNSPDATKLKQTEDQSLKELSDKVGDVMDKLKLDKSKVKWDTDLKKLVVQEPPK